MLWTKPVPRRKCHILQRLDFTNWKPDSSLHLIRSFENLNTHIENLTSLLRWNLSKGHKHIIINLYSSKLNNQKKVIFSFVLTAQEEVFLRGYVKLGLWTSPRLHWKCVQFFVANVKLFKRCAYLAH